MTDLTTPITEEDIANLNVGEQINISGTIYTGRDAALPQLVELIEKDEVPFDLKGSVIMHTSKVEIESTIGPLSAAGVRIHIGKGMLSDETVEALDKNKSIFVITPPVAALLTNKVLEKKCILFENEGMEAMYELKVEDIPGIVAIHDKKRI